MSPLLSRQLTFWGAALALTVITLVAAGYYIYETPLPVAESVVKALEPPIAMQTGEQVQAADQASPGLADYKDALLIMEDLRGETDVVQAKLKEAKYFEKVTLAAGKGHILSMILVARYAQSGLENPDHELAFKYLLQAAMRGCDFAAAEVALCFSRGIGVHPNPQLARHWFERAIQFRRADLLASYGNYLWHTGKTDAEVKYGLNLLREASTAGDAEASFKVAGAMIKTVELTPAIRQDISNRVRAGAGERNWNCANLMMELYQSGLAYPEGEDERKAYYWSLISQHLAADNAMKSYCDKMVKANGAKLSKDIRTFEQMFAQDWIEQNSEEEE